ncbi:MAG: hypothetical protein GWN01_13715 [Nitrosopumilaceae archaeon]|nr:hypothetical protein [Nitrosopumilaceae archaeon]NIU01922.1 hypothetical protein [Nitrosopumilaceae archaeon]NIU88326.1 hypothetical protein [Nitrosopumilaceae archaeon]NIV66618.1 hypothetical protein [Nitrosopumilaceae archaeon]NIX62523.1 hypothetical protein [Nitrosopumilaceae archaeon]
MENKSTLVLIAVMAAGILGTYGVITTSATSLMTAETQGTWTPMIGHVELTLKDAAGNIKSYHQFDNQVVTRGDDCASVLIFGSTTGTETCDSSAVFQYIGIGNDTTAIDDTRTDIGSAATSTTDGLMAVLQDTTPNTDTGPGAQTTITNDRSFSFQSGAGAPVTNATDSENTVTVQQVALFDDDCTHTAQVAINQGICDGTAAADDLFAAQDVTISVSSGDTLDVTWTVTVGSSG